MNSPFTTLITPLPSCYLVLLPENYDTNGKHMEYRDKEGVLFARMAKVPQNGAFFALFDVFQHAKPVYAELRDAENTLLMTTLSHVGNTRRECKVEIHLADGTLFGYLYDAEFGADFALPDETLIGMARRPNDQPNEHMEVLYTYTDAADQVLGTFERSYPDRSSTLWDLLDCGGVRMGRALEQVILEPTAAASLEPTLRTFLFLFPALQHLRYFRLSV